MLGFLSSIFSSGVVGSIERIASEAITTDKESAEAKSLFIKTLDPNGLMRRELSRFSCIAYGFYLVSTTVLMFMQAFDIGNAAGAMEAASMMKELFLPITTAWGGIVGASFGVNGINSYKEK